MDNLIQTHQRERCTVIESLYGEVKLIKRSFQPQPGLVTLSFSNLKDCLEYVDKNQFEVNVMYSGKRKKESENK